MSELYSAITSCRVCGGDNLVSVLDLGELCISDFIKPGDPEHKAPLELVMCDQCSLVQLRHTVSRDLLYKTFYHYQSSTNESMVKALKNIVDDACKHVKLWPCDKVLDIGCNDGTLLSFYPSMVDCYGYEPAWNLWEKAKKKSRGCIYPSYFPRPLLIRDQYKIITSIAQLYNVDDLNAYVSTIKQILKPEGVWVVQMQGLEGMLACNGVDNICHEHLTYISLLSMHELLKRHDLRITDISTNSTNGGSVRYTIQHGQDDVSILPDHRQRILKFGERAEEQKREMMNLLYLLRLQGKSVIGLAASTKANTLLQYYGIGPELIQAIADRNPDKVGKQTVGTHIPIISEKELYERKPDYVIVLAWHFLDSFKSRYKDLSVGWIVPLPTLSVEVQPCQHIAGEHSDNHSVSSICEI